MYHTTGFTRDEIVDLCARLHAANEAAAESEKVTWPPILGLFTSMVVTLTYLRRNRIQAEIGESYGVSQSTISRAVTALTPLLGTTLAPDVPVAEDLRSQAHSIVDGTLLPCWSWASHPELYSGKHKTTGMNVHVACTLTGGLAWISDPIDGSRHDTYCLKESGVLAGEPSNWMGDKGYVGNDMLTPIKNPPTETCWTGKKSSTSRSTKSVTSSNRSSRTSKPGESCILTIGAHWTRSPRPSQPSSLYTSTNWALNKPHCICRREDRRPQKRPTKQHCFSFSRFVS
jgi:hypothetical protein